MNCTSDNLFIPLSMKFIDCLCPAWTVMKLMGYRKCLNKNLWVYFLDQYVIIMFLLSDVLLSVWYVLLSMWYMCCLFGGSTVGSTMCYYWCQHNVCLVPCCGGWYSSCYVVQLYTCVHCCVGHFSYVVWYMCTYTLLCWTTSSCVTWYSSTLLHLENVLIVLCESYVANECCRILFSSKECSSTKPHTKSVVSNESCTDADAVF